MIRKPCHVDMATRRQAIFRICFVMVHLALAAQHAKECHVPTLEPRPLQVPEDLWSREQVRTALRTRDVGLLFRLLKRYAGTSQTRIGSAVALEQGYISKIMNGRRTVAAIDLLDRIATGLRMPDECRMLLGLAPIGTAWRPDMAGADKAWHFDGASRPQARTEPTVALPRRARGVRRGNTGGEQIVEHRATAAHDWPELTGVRLACLVGMVDSWRSEGDEAMPETLQLLVDREMLLFDVVAQDSEDPSHAFSRRQALATLAALPVAFTAPLRNTQLTGSGTAGFVSRCAASLTACWHMLRGSDLRAVSRILPAYMLRLETVAQGHSQWRFL